MDRTSSEADAHDDQRWAAALSHRSRLLRLARSRSLTPEDAEDVVQEALLRCVQFENLDDDRLDRLLTTVTLRLCIDEHRRRNQTAKLRDRLTAEPETAPGPDERVCDLAEAVWVASLVDRLPAQQREVLAAKANGLSCSEIGAYRLMSYKAVESALRHARAKLRSALAATVAVVAGASSAGKWRGRTAAVAILPVLTATVAIGGGREPTDPVREPTSSVFVRELRETAPRPMPAPRQPAASATPMDTRPRRLGLLKPRTPIATVPSSVPMDTVPDPRVPCRIPLDTFPGIPCPKDLTVGGNGLPI